MAIKLNWPYLLAVLALVNQHHPRGRIPLDDAFHSDDYALPYANTYPANRNIPRLAVDNHRRLCRHLSAFGEGRHSDLRRGHRS
jgi:hypothetical protein